MTLPRPLNSCRSWKIVPLLLFLTCGMKNVASFVLPTTAMLPSSSSTTITSISTKGYTIQESWSITSLQMQPPSTEKDNQVYKKRRRQESLNAVSIAEDWESKEDNRNLLEEWSIWPVLSTSLMITGNTVGAGMLVLPELVEAPGMGMSTLIFVGAFCMNLLSGLLIADVAITQKEASGDDVPSSFQEFAQVNLQSTSAAAIISFISILVNALVMAFNTVKIGSVGTSILSVSDGSIPSEWISMVWMLASIALVGTQSFQSLSTVTSFMVAGLFISFAGLLLPGLAELSSSLSASSVNPLLSMLMTPGTSTDPLASASQLAPIILMSLVYQNIVPTVTKMLDYDRSKTTAAITLGSLIPLLMYISWSFVVVGGGIDNTAVGLNGPLMTIFTLTTIAGSSIGCIVSLSEEFDTFFQPSNKISDDKVTPSTDTIADTDTDRFSMPAVLASVACTGIAMHLFSDDLNEALKVAGSLGSPLLYGVLPVIMAYVQRKQAPKAPLPTNLPDATRTTTTSASTIPSMFLPNLGLGVLGAASSGFVGNELFHTAEGALAMFAQ